MAYICLDGLKTSGANIVGVLGPKKNHGAYGDFKSFVEKIGLNFIEYDKLTDEKLVAEIKALKADIAVVCSFNYKVPKVLLDSVKGGFINVHPSLLPKYRGANPYSSVIINGEAETGVTLHFMDEGFDTGDLISQKKVSISEKETMGTIFNRLNILAFEMLHEALCIFEENDLRRIKQPQGEYALGNSIEGEAQIIDFSKSAQEIERFIRGLNPFLCAVTNLRGNFVKIHSAEYLDSDTDEIQAGTVVKVDDDNFYVATGKGLLAPTVLQFGSFFIGTAKDFIKMLDLKVGEKFN